MINAQNEEAPELKRRLSDPEWLEVRGRAMVRGEELLPLQHVGLRVH